MSRSRLFIILLTLVFLLTSLPACSTQAVREYTRHQVRDIELSYPSDWVDRTEELAGIVFAEDPAMDEYATVVAWGTPADTADLLVLSMDREAIEMPTGLTLEEKEFFSSSFVGAFMTEMTQPTLLSQEATEIAGEWAWEVGFTGKGEGLIGGDLRGNIIVFFTKQSVCVLIFLADHREWDNVSDAYIELKESIQLY